VTSTRAEESLAELAVRRRTAERQAAAEDEVRRLLDVGLELMRENPEGNPKIADIVRRARVSNDAFYRSFRSKDDLMAAIADDGARRVLEYVRHQRAKATDAAGRLRACVECVLNQVADAENARTTRGVVMNIRRADSGTPGVRLRDRIGELMAESLAELGSPDPARDGYVASCAAFGVMEQFLWSERTPTAADREHLLDWLLRAARP
jgi:AcrR family transcriptional regulator